MNSRSFSSLLRTAIIALLSLVSFLTNATTLVLFHSFSTLEGYTPDYPSGGGLILASDGCLYGTTTLGGLYSYGSVFKITTEGVFTNLHSFNGTSEGRDAMGSLVEGSDGNFYGTTERGGANGYGTVFRLTPAGDFTLLHTFNLNDGGRSNAGLVEGVDGFLYGTTPSGGAKLLGTIFRISTNGALTTLYSFNGSVDRGIPYGTMVKGDAGDFYGTTGTYTSSNGTNNYGTIFRVTTNGTLTTLYYFSGQTNHSAPLGLTRTPDGTLYGVTQGGQGTVFRLNTNGDYSTLYTFTNLSPTNARNPTLLAQGSNGSLFGTTLFGGEFNRGTVYQIGTNGGITVLASFDTSVGTLPKCRLVEGAGGNFYGTTTAFGGSIFRFGLLPEIRVPPVSRTNFIGTTASFNVVADAFAPASYQWQKDSTNLADSATLSGATTPSLSISNVSFADAGVYSFVVVDTFGSVTSAPVSLTVVDAAPAILTQPLGTTVLAGDTAQFTVSAEGSLPMSFQWQRHGTNLLDDGNISGSTTSNLILNTATPVDSGDYSVLVGNHLDTVESSNATLAVLPVIIGTQPIDQTALDGGSVSFQVWAYGDSPITYQWQRDTTNLSNGPGISGATSEELVLTNLTPSSAGHYSVIISNPFGSLSSSQAILTVVATVPLPVALDAPQLPWSTSALSPWFGQTNFSHDGNSAARSDLLAGWDSWVETTVEGPGILTFWWQLLITGNCFELQLWRNGLLQTNRLHSTTPWQQQSVTLPAGTQVLRWRLANYECSAGLWEGGYLDQVSFVSLAPPVFQTVTHNNGQVAFTWSALAGRSYQVQYTTNLFPAVWSDLGGTVVPTNSLAVASDTAGTAPQRYYRVLLLP